MQLGENLVYGFVFFASATGYQSHLSLVVKLSVKRVTVSFRVHRDIVNAVFETCCFVPHSFGFVATVGHPHEASQNRMPMTGQSETTVTIYPAISMRCAPCSLFIEATQAIGEPCCGKIPWPSGGQVGGWGRAGQAPFLMDMSGASPDA